MGDDAPKSNTQIGIGLCVKLESRMQELNRTQREDFV